MAAGLELAGDGGRAQSRRGADWNDIGPHPWRRYFARCLDTTVFGWITLMAIGLSISGLSSPEHRASLDTLLRQRWPLLDLFVLLPAAIPANAVVIGLTGTSPGKWA